MGARTGPAKAYVWTPASPMPMVLPWLVILGLLVLRVNRSAQAWWIWVPLGCLFAIAQFAALLDSLIDMELLTQVMSPLAFGVAAVWLMSPYLSHRLRIIASGKMFLAVASFSVVAFFAGVDWNELGMNQLGLLVSLVFSSAILVVALSLAGLVCRRHYRPVGLWAALTGWLAAIGFLICAPFMVLSMVINESDISWWFLAMPLLYFIAAGLIILSPFLLLSFTNAFYRERLINLLRLGSGSPPALPVPPVIASGEVR